MIFQKFRTGKTCLLTRRHASMKISHFTKSNGFTLAQMLASSLLMWCVKHHSLIQHELQLHSINDFSWCTALIIGRSWALVLNKFDSCSAFSIGKWIFMSLCCLSSWVDAHTITIQSSQEDESVFTHASNNKYTSLPLIKFTISCLVLVSAHV